MERPLLEDGADTFIRWNEAIPILRKVASWKEPSFDGIVSSRKPFGFPTNYLDFQDLPDSEHPVKIYVNGGVGYIAPQQIERNAQWVDKYKVLISGAYGERGKRPYRVVGKPIVVGGGTCCTETYMVIGPFDTREEAENAASYVRTKFFRLLVALHKNTQHATGKVYAFVPSQDFGEPWTDEKLYAKYGISEEESEFIDSLIRPMEPGDARDE
jgi:site-specific DNA-methyltransferase (adenine-specific)